MTSRRDVTRQVLARAARSRRVSRAPSRRTSSSTSWRCRRSARRRGSTDSRPSTAGTRGARRSCGASRTSRRPRSAPVRRSSADWFGPRPCAPGAENAAPGWTAPASPQWTQTQTANSASYPPWDGHIQPMCGDVPRLRSKGACSSFHLWIKGKERKSIYIALFWPRCMVHSKRSGIDQTVLPANNTMPAFPSWAFTRCQHHSNWGSGHPIAAHYSFIDPEKMKGWVGLSVRVAGKTVILRW